MGLPNTKSEHSKNHNLHVTGQVPKRTEFILTFPHHELPPVTPDKQFDLWVEDSHHIIVCALLFYSKNYHNKNYEIVMDPILHHWEYCVSPKTLEQIRLGVSYDQHHAGHFTYENNFWHPFRQVWIAAQVNCWTQFCFDGDLNITYWAGKQASFPLHQHDSQQELYFLSESVTIKPNYTSLLWTSL